MISIIIPVYNVEKYIERCVKSLLDQSYSDFEIILIDDGSKDDSAQIIDYLQKKHPDKIIVEHQQNSGVSAARNRGIELAHGHYITFVDSDDWVDNNYLSGLMSVEADLVVSGLILEKKEQTFITPEQSFIRIPQDKLGFFNLLMLRLLYGPYQKMYRSSIIKNHHILFQLGNQFGEDRIFNYDYLSHVDTIATVPCASYHYRIAESGSLCSKYIHNLAELQYKQWHSLLHLVEDRRLQSPQLMQELYRVFFFEVLLDNMQDSQQLSHRKNPWTRYRYIKDMLSIPEIQYLSEYLNNIPYNKIVKLMIVHQHALAMTCFTYL